MKSTKYFNETINLKIEKTIYNFDKFTINFSGGEYSAIFNNTERIKNIYSNDIEIRQKAIDEAIQLVLILNNFK